MAMNKRIKKQWVTALRSGEYKKATGSLRQLDRTGKTTGFCCLGVLCNLHAIAHPEIAKKQIEAYQYMGQKELLPLAVARWAGVDRNGMLSGTVDLVTLNDYENRSFKYIADVIEKHA